MDETASAFAGLIMMNRLDKKAPAFLCTDGKNDHDVEAHINEKPQLSLRVGKSVLGETAVAQMRT